MNPFLLQRDIDIVLQGSKEIFSRIEVIDDSFKIIESIESIVISDSLSIQSDSDLRRTYSCELLIQDVIHSNEFISLINKHIRSYIGIRYIRTNEIIWYLLGTFCITDFNYNYDSITHTLSLSCEDFMCLLNGSMGGNIKDQKLKIPAESDMREVIIGLLNECNITKYMISGIDKKIPYDLEYSSSNYYEVLKAIVDLYAGYEMFFDINGIFIIQEIPKGYEDENILNDDIIYPLLINDNGSMSAKEIYNHIIIYGRSIETDRMVENATYQNNIYNGTLDGFVEYENLTTYSFNLPSSCEANARLSINNISAKAIVKDDGVQLNKGDLTSGTYSFRYRKVSDDFLLLGQYQVFGEAKDTDDNSPFSIQNLKRDIIKTLQDDEYEKIYTDDLANQRAKYELYKSTKLQNTIGLTMIYVPWLDVNMKISYTSKNSGETYEYLVKSISSNTNEFTMTIDLVQVFKEYST